MHKADTLSWSDSKRFSVDSKELALVVVILVIFCTLAEAQPFSASVKHYGPEQGLSHREVNAIFQDRQGFMWFGTKFGLNRFDGLKFTTYTKERNGLAFDDIQAIAQDADGLLWLMGPYSQAQITLFNPLTGSTVSFEEKFKMQPLANSIVSKQRVFGSDNGTIFFANYRPAALVSYHPKLGLHYSPLPQYKNLTVLHVTARNTVWAIADYNILLELTPDGRVLHTFGHDQAGIEVCLGQRNAGIEFFYLAYGTPTRPQNLLYTIDEQGNRRNLPASLLQLRTRAELLYPVCYAFDRTGLIWNGTQLRDSTKGTLLDLKDKLAGQSTENRCFFRDKNGWMWLGTSFGVYQVKVVKNYFRRLFYEPTNAEEKAVAVRGITVIGNKVYANLEKLGLFSCNPFGGSVKSLFGHGVSVGLSNNQQGKLFVGQINQLAMYDLATGSYTISPLAKAESIWTQYPISNQHFIAGGLLGLWLVEAKTGKILPFTRYNQFPELAQSHVLHIAADRQGNFWICATTGLYTFDPSMGITARYWSGGKGRFRLPADSYQHFYQDPRGLFWLATANSGLIRWDRKQNTYRQFRRTEGLSNDNIYAVYADRRGHLWLSSDYGIMQVDPVRMATRSYSVQDGITHNEFNRISHFQATNGQLYLGGLNGITSFNPQDFEQEKLPDALPLRLVSFRQFDNALDKLVDRTQELSKTAKITVEPGDRSLILEFAMLNYSDAEKNVYAYQLKGIDTEWSHQSEPFLRLSNLPYGDHQLLIKAQAANGQQSVNVLAINLTVLRPFYLRPWFLVLMGVLFIGTVWGWVRWRIWNHRLEQVRLQTEIVRATSRIEADKEIIAQQAQALQHLNETKSHFFTNISHEFRTPLTVILGMTAELKRYKPEKIRLEAGLGLIERNGSSLLRLINQILDLSKLEAGEMPLHLVRADLVGFIRYVGESFQSLARSREIQLHFLSDEETFEADFDKDKLQDIIANLLANALKFTPPGGHVYCQLRVRKNWQSLNSEDYFEELTPTTQLAGPWIQISVGDTGPGIEPASLPKIFDRFYQVGTLAGGTGIGLSLVRELVGLMQGGLAVRNRSENGTEFLVSLPLTRQAQLAEGMVHALGSVSPVQSEWVPPVRVKVGERPVLLLVEDNDDVATYIHTCIGADYRVMRADNGQVGIEMALEKVPDLILSDVMMPLKDGFALCDTLKNDERTSHIPIVLLTAKAAFSDRIAGLQRGADAYLVKPFQREELVVVLSNLFQTRRILQLHYSQRALGTAKAQPIAENESESREDVFLQKLRTHLYTQLDNEELTIEDVCQLMNMSRTTLHLKLTALTGMPFTQYLRLLRLHKAQVLLTTSELNISEVAYAVGFKDPKYFSRAFSEAFGVSPAHFRQSARA